MTINLKIQKKDLWLLSAIMIFLIGVGYVVAIGENYQIHGHDSDEINLPVCGNGQILKYSGGIWSCQNDNLGTDTRCSTSGTCTQVCIGTNCRTSWPVDTRCSTSGTCTQVCIGTNCKNSWPILGCQWASRVYSSGARCNPTSYCSVSGSNKVMICQSDGSWSLSTEAYPCSANC